MDKIEGILMKLCGVYNKRFVKEASTQLIEAVCEEIQEIWLKYEPGEYYYEEGDEVMIEKFKEYIQAKLREGR